MCVIKRWKLLCADRAAEQCSGAFRVCVRACVRACVTRPFGLQPALHAPRAYMWLEGVLRQQTGVITPHSRAYSAQAVVSTDANPCAAAAGRLPRRGRQRAERTANSVGASIKHLHPTPTTGLIGPALNHAWCSIIGSAYSTMMQQRILSSRVRRDGGRFDRAQKVLFTALTLSVRRMQVRPLYSI